jgi:hypothetical protein
MLTEMAALNQMVDETREQAEQQKLRNIEAAAKI